MIQRVSRLTPRRTRVSQRRSDVRPIASFGEIAGKEAVMLLRGTAASRGNRACGRHAVNAAVLSLLVGVIVAAPWATSAASASTGHTVPAVAVYNGEFHVEYRT